MRSPDKQEEIEQALANGLLYLEKQSADGLFREDFGLRHGLSTGWTTAYVGRLLKEVDPRRAEKSVEPLLALQNSDGGWGYNELVPSDSDSTANAIVLLQGEKSFTEERRIQAVDCIRSHQCPNGGISTYTQENIHKMGYSGDGWASPHVCATALAARFLAGFEQQKARGFLMRHRQQDGSFPSYWWASDLYSTLETVKLTGCFDQKTLNFFRTQESKDCFELALKIQGLSLMGQDAHALIGDLLALQSGDGSWPDSAILKIPRPDVRPGFVASDVEVARDKTRLLTTSNALLALKMAS